MKLIQLVTTINKVEETVEEVFEFEGTEIEDQLGARIETEVKLTHRRR